MLSRLFSGTQALVERTPLSLPTWLTAFAGIVIIRDLLEQYSSYTPGVGSRLIIDFPALVHYGLFYLAAALFMALILVIGAGRSLRTATTIVLLGLPIIWLPPLVDLFSAGMGGHLMTYLLVSGPELLQRFLTFFGGHITTGATLGIQVEIALIVLAAFWYVREATGSLVRALLSAFAAYASIFALGSIPSLLALGAPASARVVTFLSEAVSHSILITGNVDPRIPLATVNMSLLGINKLMSEILVIVVAGAASMLFYLGARDRFLAVMKNARLERILHVLLLFTFGLVLSGPLVFSWINALSIVVVGLAFVFAGWFAVAENDLYDKEIDSVSNPDRPSITHTLSDADFRFSATLFGLGALLAAYAVAAYALFFVVLFMLTYHIYSTPPLRLKRVFLLNSALVAITSLSAVFAGFFLFRPDGDIAALSPGLVVALFVAYALGANLKDLKDTAGDRSAGILTISTLLGDRTARWVVSVITAGVFVYIPVIALNIRTMLFPSVLMGVLLIAAIQWSPYREWRAFVIYLAYLGMLVGAVATQLP